MKQVIVRKGEIVVDDIPAPKAGENNVLVKVAYSCISAGTEMSTVSSSHQSLLKRTLQYPQQAKKVLNGIKTSGILTTMAKVQDRLVEGSELGYSAAGTVLEVGRNITDINPGDRVACAGAGIANHAECISVPKNLLVKIPAEIDFDIASTVTLGAIAMQSVRRADMRLGEYAVVIGLGILGQLIVQILRAAGIRAIGIDIDERRVQIALDLGLDFGMVAGRDDVVSRVISITNGYGADVVIVATATTSREPLSQAFRMSRKKGKVVLVGVAGMEIDRDEMYQKELDFLISTSYGPGRYDEEYESKGVQYPYAYVRWTETRNLEEYLHLIAEQKIRVKPLIEHMYPVGDAALAYQEFKNPNSKPLIVLLKYPQSEEDTIIRRIEVFPQNTLKQDRISIGIIGFGGFAKDTHLPNLKRLKKYYSVDAIASRSGYKAKAAAKRYKVTYVTTDYKDILRDANINAVLIATRHDSHADLAIEALKAGKAVFLEKPMSLNESELQRLVKVIEETNLPFMIGFNRRFSPFAQEAKHHIDKRVNPMVIDYRMNAGYVRLDHWVHTQEGGGRIVGEGCHIFDLFNFFTDSEVENVVYQKITPKTKAVSDADNAIIVVKYKDGSVSQLTYTALGSSKYPKEFCEIYFDNKVITIDDYKEIKGYGVKVRNIKTRISNKGHLEELVQFARFVKGESSSPIPLWQMVQATRLSLMVADSSLKVK